MKGVGKTTLLQSVVIASSLLFPNVIPIFLNYGHHAKWAESPLAGTPVRLIPFAVERRKGIALDSSNQISNLNAQKT
jgi:hypothetical protein